MINKRNRGKKKGIYLYPLPLSINDPALPLIESERQIVGRTFTHGLLCRRERRRCSVCWRERCSLRCSDTSHRCAGYGLLTTDHVICSDIVEPTSVELVSINIKLHGKILALLNIELFDTILSKDTEKTFTWILSGHFNHVVLRHPVVSCTCRHTTLSRQYCNNSTC